MNRKYNQKYVEEYFKKYECKLIDTYRSTKYPIKFRCSCGNISFIKFLHFKKKHKCKKCNYAETNKYKKHTQDYVEGYFKENGCELLDNYRNDKSTLIYICSCGNTSNIRFSDFKKGQRCMKCAIKKRSGKNHYNWNPDRQKIEVRRKVDVACRSLIYCTLKATGHKKTCKTENMLGYSRGDFLNKLKRDPLFENWKNNSYNYHIDHIFPIKSFIDEKIYDPKIINALDNLRILPSHSNWKKSSKCDKLLFNKYLKNTTTDYIEEEIICT